MSSAPRPLYVFSLAVCIALLPSMAVALPPGGDSGDSGSSERRPVGGNDTSEARTESRSEGKGAGAAFQGGTRVPFRLTLIPLVSLPPSQPDDAVPAYAFNVVGRNHALKGFETAVLFNTEAAYADGAQFAFVGNWVSGPTRGLQGSGILNVSAGDMQGVGAALGANVAGGLRGLQASLVGNLVLEDAYGVQLGGINWAAGSVAGVQAGTMNVAGDLAGLQGGLLNVGREVDGLQLGLLNVAERSEVSLGMVNINWGRPAYVHGWVNETGLASIGLQHGSEHVYHFLRAGYQPIGAERLFVPGVGFGGHFPVQYLGIFSGYLEVDALYNLAIPTRDTGVPPANWLQARVTLGLDLIGRLAVYGGLSANALVTDQTGPVLAPPDTPPSVDPAPGAGIWPGLFVGVRL